jgi:hypothetical protein
MIHPTMAWRRRGSDDIVVTNIIGIAVYETEINVDTIHRMGYSIVRLHMTLRDRYGTNKRCNPSENVLYAASTITGIAEELIRIMKQLCISLLVLSFGRGKG